MGTHQKKNQERFSTSSATSSATLTSFSGFRLSGFTFIILFYILYLCCVYNGRG